MRAVAGACIRTLDEGVKEFPWSFARAAPPVQSLRDSAAATPVGGAAWRRRFRIFSFRSREMMSGMTMLFFSLGGVPVSVCVLTTGVVIRSRAVSGETARGGFGLGDSFTRSGAVRHACRRWTGSTRFFCFCAVFIAFYPLGALKRQNPPNFPSQRRFLEGDLNSRKTRARKKIKKSGELT